MAALMVSISGIRGIIGESLTPEVITKYVAALARYTGGGKIVLGRDSRVSGPFIRDVVAGVLSASGCQVIDVGLVPTPTVQLEVEHHQADGGIVITASHNPIQWNGLKFIDRDGRFLAPAAARKVYGMADEGETAYQPWNALGSVQQDQGAVQRHIDRVLQISYLDVEAIRKRRFKVVVDTVNGAGGVIIPQLLEALGCEVIPINQQPSGIFAHVPEPLPENLTELSAKVKETDADVGFAVDPDVDRCAIVDNTGRPIGEEYTLVIATKLIFSHTMGRMVINMSTSRASEDLARYYNCHLERAAVGEINVAEKMKEIEAIIGGEGNGGVILPEVHLGRDAPVAVALTLQALLEFGGTMEELRASLPQYEMVKKKVAIQGLNPDELLAKIKEQYKDYPINELDGIKIDFDHSWVHLRKSNTEPIIRVISEAPTLSEAEQLADKFLNLIQQLAQ